VGKGSSESKVEALTMAGATVVDLASGIGVKGVHPG